MSQILDRINSTYEKKVKASERVQSKREDGDRFKAYEEALDSKSTLKVTFDTADTEGNLSCVDVMGVEISLKAESFARSTNYYNKNIKAKFVGMELSVKVESIDKKNGVVYVKSAVNNSDMRGALVKQICKKLDAGETPRLWGSIIFVNDKKVTVNILGQNILGFIRVKEWSPNFTSRLRTHANVGEDVEFDVLERMPHENGKDIAFRLSRRATAPNPWEECPEFAEGDIITIKCIDKPVDKKYFWGQCSRVKGIDLICKYGYKIPIVVGGVYKAKVNSFDREKKRFICEPIELIPVGNATAENIRFIKGGKD